MNAFLEGGQTDTTGGTLIEPRIVKGVKVYDMTMEQVDWEISKGVTKPAMAFNGIVPGPEVRVQPGRPRSVRVQNQLDQPSMLHFHGLTVPNSEDGVPYITQAADHAGGVLDVRLHDQGPAGDVRLPLALQLHRAGRQRALRRAHRRAEAARLEAVYGAEPDEESSMFLGDGPLGYEINGKSFPADRRRSWPTQGDWVLIHMANDGSSCCTRCTCTGSTSRWWAQDGFPLAPANRYMADTLVVAPGQRFDLLVHADSPGPWAFHCHILNHVEGPEGMFGMVTALVVNK